MVLCNEIRVISYLFSFLIILSNETAIAETMKLIENGKVVAGATAIWNEYDSEEIKNRLFKSTVLINQSLIQMSGDSFSNERFENFKNKIRIKIVDTIGYDVYTLWLVDTGKGKELRISGNNIENVERAVHYFLTKYLHIEEDTLKDLKELVDKLILNKERLDFERMEQVVFKRSDNLVFEQQEIEMRKLFKRK